MLSFHKQPKAKLHAVLLLTLKGTPFIYYGDEIGMENTDIPKHRIRDLYGKIFYPLYKGRDGARTPMQWNSTDFAGFSTVKPFLPVNKNYKLINVETEANDEKSIYSVYKKLIAIRNQYSVLQSGEINFLNKGNNNVLIYSRYSENKELVILLNFGFTRKKIKIENLKNPTILFSTHNSIRKITDNILLEPYEGLIVELVNSC
jgi:alpha-glucosidase